MVVVRRIVQFWTSMVLRGDLQGSMSEFFMQTLRASVPLPNPR